MGYELLEQMLDILTAAGLRAGEEYPAGERVEILSPVAAVGLRELDCADGEARFSVRVLSPRILGGWCCQTQGARAAQALYGAGLTVQTAEMEFLSGSDCFCVSLTASLAVVREGEGWAAGARWRALCDEVELEGVVSFRAVRNQGRRLVGAMGSTIPGAVTPGAGGWEIELRQRDAEEEQTAEPFTLTVFQGSTGHRYSGCCWNETEFEYTQRGLTLVRRGFALEREAVG